MTVVERESQCCRSSSGTLLQVLQACREKKTPSVLCKSMEFFSAFESGNRSTFGQVKLGTLVSRAFSLLSFRLVGSFL